MRIVMVTNHFPKFSETFIVSKFIALVDRGWDVHIACRQSVPAQWDLFPALSSRRELQERVHLATDLATTLTELAPDLVHFEFGVLAVGRTKITERLGCKIVVSFRGSDLFATSLDTPHYYDEVWQRADVLHLLGRQLWRQALARGCPTTKPHVFIAPGIDKGFAGVAPRQHVDPTGVEGRPLRLLSVGRLEWVKGFEYGLLAVRRLVDAGIRCEYDIVGDGDLRNALTFAIHDLRLQGIARLVGLRSRHEVQDHMQWADAFLHPALFEGFCNVVLEAQAMGLPVVCSDGGGLRQNVVDGVTGFICPRRDAPAMAEALAYLVAPGLRRRLGEAGRHRVARSFRAENQISRFERLYRTVLNRSDGTVRDRTKAGAAVTTVTRRPLMPVAIAPADTQLAVLKQQLSQLDVSAQTVRKDIERLELIERIRRHVARTLPPDARVSVVSRGDDELLQLDGRACSHFPASADGIYAGYHPAESAEAIAAVQAARAKGIQYLLIPRTSFWWLDHYTELTRYLKEHCVPLGTSDSCVIFGIQAPAAAGFSSHRSLDPAVASAALAKPEWAPT